MPVRGRVGVVVDGRLGLLASWHPQSVPRLIDLRMVPSGTPLISLWPRLGLNESDWVLVTASRADEVPETIAHLVVWRSPVCPENAIQRICAQRKAALFVSSESDLAHLDERISAVVFSGWEAGGIVAEESSLVFLRRVLGDIDRDVWVLGGLGPDAAAGAIEAGAQGVFLSDVLWATPEASAPLALLQLLEQFDPSDTDGLGRYFDFRVRVFRQQATKPPKVFETRELGFRRAPKERAAAACWQLLLRSLAESDINPLSTLVPLGQSGALACPLRDRFGHAEAIVEHYQATIETSQRELEMAADLTDTIRRSAGSSAHSASKTASPARSRAPQPALEFNIDERADGIAIVGVGAKVPGALSAEAFWDNIRRGDVSITEVPVDVWDPALYWDPDPAAPDKTYSKIGGFVRGFELNRKRFRLPPRVVESMDPAQQLALAAAAEALEDAGLLERDFDRSRCAVILGVARGGSQRELTDARIRFPAFTAALLDSARDEGLSDAAVARLLAQTEGRFKAGLPAVTEDTLPGELSSVVAGRICNVFDLTGANFTTDAAGGSSFAALEAAVGYLESGTADIVLTGGVDRTMSPLTYVKFAKLGALSAGLSCPFDERASGFVMGEGAILFVVKRLSDAVRDDDRIYAMIRGIGGASDGRGKGVTAPNPDGQLRALRSAYQNAGISPRDIGLLEAHGTSTRVGDAVEMQSFAKLFDTERLSDRKHAIRLGSVKSNIGHLKAAAGAAGLFKAAMALHHKVLPATCNIETANPNIDFDAVPVRLQTETEPWEDGDKPRRVGVSAFGFGGSNFHVVLEEIDLDRRLGHKPDRSRPRAHSAELTIDSRFRPASSDAPLVDAVGLRATDRAQLVVRLTELVEALETSGQQAYDAVRLPRPANDDPTEREPVRLAISGDGPAAVSKLATRALRALRLGASFRILENQGVYLRGLDHQRPGKTAFLFTGQGSQYLNMGADLRSRYPEVEHLFSQSDSRLQDLLGKPLSDFVFVDTESDEAFTALSQTEITQPAILTLDAAIFEIVRRYGLRPDVVAGHSLGEYAACIAAGILSFDDAIRTVAVRGRAMAEKVPDGADRGLMCSLPLPPEEVEPHLRRFDGRVVIVNKNSPKQTIIGGYSPEMRSAVDHLDSMGVQTMLLPVSHAFHTEIVAPAAEVLGEFLEGVAVRAPRTTLLSNTDATPYPRNPEEIRRVLSRQLARPVEWSTIIERMYASGVRTFIEIGPKRALASFVSHTLEDRPHRVYSSNHPRVGGLASISRLIAASWADAATGVPATMSTAVSAPFLDQAYAALMEELCNKTGYDSNEIEPDFDLEGDLGVDTVKQAEIVAAVRERFELPRDDDFRLADYPTLEDLVDYLVECLNRGRLVRPKRVEPRAPIPTADDPPKAGLVAEASTEPTRARPASHDTASTGWRPAPSEGLLEMVELSDDGMSATAGALLEAGEIYLNDYRIGDTPVLPAVMAIELCAELCQHLAGGKAFRGVDQMRFERPIALLGDAPLKLTITAVRADFQSDGTVVFNVTLWTTREGRDAGVKPGNEAADVFGKVRFGAVGEGSRSPLQLSIAGGVRRGLERDDIYELVPQTGCYAILDELVAVGDRMAVAEGRISGSKLSTWTTGLPTDPLLSDMVFQAGTLFGYATLGAELRPSAIKRSSRLRSVIPGERLTTRVAIREISDERVTLDAEVIADDGQGLGRFFGVELVTSDAAIGRRAVELPNLTVLTGDLRDAELPPSVFESIEGLATPTEADDFARKRIDRARRDWVASRILVKRQVTDFYRRFYGLGLKPIDIEIRKDDVGAPSVHIAQELDPSFRPPAVSISHSQGRAVTALVPPWRRVRAGIDVERVEERSDRFAQDFFSSHEREIANESEQPQATLTAIWSLKEAASKALGMGTHLNFLKEIRVIDFGDRDATIEFAGVARERLKQLNATFSRARWALDDGFAVASVELTALSNGGPSKTELASVAAVLMHTGYGQHS